MAIRRFSLSSFVIYDKIREKKAEIIISDKKKAFLNGVEKKGTTDFIGEFYAVIKLVNTYIVEESILETCNDNIIFQAFLS